MNNKKFIDKVEAHLLRQERQCGDSEQYHYADAAGNRCAIGAVLPLAVATRIAGTWGTVVDAGKYHHPAHAAVQILSQVDLALISQAQWLHDAHPERDDSFRKLVREWASEARAKYA